MTLQSDSISTVGRRIFLKQTFAFSALAAIGTQPGMAKSDVHTQHGASEILMIGDWGYEDATAQTKVAAGLRDYAEKQSIRPEAFFLLGDNWYGALNGGAQSQFESMYPENVFNCPAYAVLGNHDYQRFPDSKVEAELEYARTSRTSSGPTRFTMPARWYTFEFPKHNPLVTFIALDSNMPHPNMNSIDSHARDFTLPPEEQAEQLAWLQNELKKPRTTPYLMVIAHHPVYSNGPHGDHATLIRDWDPLFREHKVTLYLAGHDHDLQHLEFENHPTSFFLSGGGGADLYTLKIDAAKRGPYAQKIYGFSHLSVSPEHLTLRHFDQDGQLLHAFLKTPEGVITILRS